MIQSLDFVGFIYFPEEMNMNFRLEKFHGEACAENPIWILGINGGVGW